MGKDKVDIKEIVKFIKKKGYEIEDVIEMVYNSLLGLEKNELSRLIEGYSIDILDELYERLLDKRFKYNNGIYYTSSELSEILINEVLIEYLISKDNLSEFKLRKLLYDGIDLLGNDKVLVKKFLKEMKVIDLSVGTGKLIDKLIDKLSLFLDNKELKEVVRKNIYGVDIVGLPIDILRKKVRFKLGVEIKNLIVGNSLIIDELDNSFDIVIGNPPYVRQERIIYKKLLEDYIVFKGTNDLYIYFYEKGYKVLKEGGVLGYISSNKWLKTLYGKTLRDFLKERVKIKQIIDFKENNYFKANVDVNIVIFKKESVKDNIFLYKSIERDKEEIEYINQNSFKSDIWILTKKEVLDVIDKIESKSVRLKDIGGIVKRAVETGNDRVFIIDSKTRDEILDNCKDEREYEETKNLIIPILKGDDIDKWITRWSGKYVINLYRGWTRERFINNYEENFKKYFPSLYSYFISKRDVLNRGGNNLENRKKRFDFWWELITDNFIKRYERRILIKRVSMENIFALEDNKFNTSNFLSYSDKNTFLYWNIEFILAYLNSSLFYLISKNYNPIYGDSIGYQAYNFYQYPFPKIRENDLSIVNEIKILVMNILNNIGLREDNERKIDELIMELFNLNEREKEIIRKEKRVRK